MFKWPTLTQYYITCAISLRVTLFSQTYYVHGCPMIAINKQIQTDVIWYPKNDFLNAVNRKDLFLSCFFPFSKL